MQIEIPHPDQQRLAQHAAAAGFETTEHYVAQFVLALASQPTPQEIPSLDDQELQESLELIEQGEADLLAGRTREMRDALLELGRQRGYALGE